MCLFNSSSDSNGGSLEEKARNCQPSIKGAMHFCCSLPGHLTPAAPALQPPLLRAAPAWGQRAVPLGWEGREGEQNNSGGNPRDEKTEKKTSLLEKRWHLIRGEKSCLLGAGTSGAPRALRGPRSRSRRGAAAPAWPGSAQEMAPVPSRSALQRPAPPGAVRGCLPAARRAAFLHRSSSRRSEHIAACPNPAL